MKPHAKYVPSAGSVLQELVAQLVKTQAIQSETAVWQLEASVVSWRRWCTARFASTDVMVLAFAIDAKPRATIAIIREAKNFMLLVLLLL